MGCVVVKKRFKCWFEPPKNSAHSLYSLPLLALLNKKRRNTELQFEAVLQVIYKIHRIYYNVLDLLTLNQCIVKKTFSFWHFNSAQPQQLFFLLWIHLLCPMKYIIQRPILVLQIANWHTCLTFCDRSYPTLITCMGFCSGNILNSLSDKYDNCY